MENNANNIQSIPGCARIGDKLYVVLQGKLYEISESGTKCISNDCYSLDFFNGELYCYFLDEHLLDEVKKYDVTNGEFVEQDKINSIYSFARGDIAVDGRWVLVDDEYYNLKLSFFYKRETLKDSVGSGDYYIYGNDIYCASHDEEIKCFNVVDKTECLVMKLENGWVDMMIVENGYLLFVATDKESLLSSVYYLELDSGSTEPKPLVKDQDMMFSVNIYGDVAFVSSTNGTLMSYDLKSGESKVVAEEKGIEGCYIFDDKWVYFTKGAFSVLSRSGVLHTTAV